MEGEKQAKRKFKIVEWYSVLILIATLFMSIGFAAISDVILNISGKVQAIAQEGVFITDVVYLGNNNANITESQINYCIGTMLDSKITLGETEESSIMYEITIYNNTDRDYIYIDAIKGDLEDNIEGNLGNNFYSNDNIVFELDEQKSEENKIKAYKTIIRRNSSLKFTITFKYEDGENITDNTLISKLNFRFRELPILELSNEGESYTLNDIYPDYEPQSYEFTVKNYNEQETNIVPMSYYFDVTIDKPLTVKIYDENGNEVTGEIDIAGDGVQQALHAYSLAIIWDNSNEEEGISYDSIEYIDKDFYCNVALKAKPNNDKYLDFIVIKEFSIDIIPSDYRETFNITYVDIADNNYPTEILEGEDLEITFTDNIPVEIEVTGCESYTYDRPTLRINNVMSDLEIKNPTEGYVLVFEHKEEYTFSGNNLLNTEIQLFDEENINKDFEISFNIVSYADTQEDYATLVNSLNEIDPYPGILLRIRNNRYEIVAQLTPDNIHYAELTEITKFQYIRRDGIIYYKINDGEEVEIQSFQGYTDYFDTPVTFGGSLDGNGNPYRYFNGTLSNMQIILLEKEKPEIEEDNDIVYQYDGEYAFNGSNHIDTGIRLFSEENIDKDFEISFNITNYAEAQSGFATLMNCLVEIAPYPGVLLRIGNNEYEIVANGSTSEMVTAQLTAITKFELIRRDRIVYYRINDGDMVQILSYEGFTDYFNTTLTFGSSLDGNGNPYRYFQGTLSNIVVKLSK